MRSMIFILIYLERFEREPRPLHPICTLAYTEVDLIGVTIYTFITAELQLTTSYVKLHRCTLCHNIIPQHHHDITITAKLPITRQVGPAAPHVEATRDGAVICSPSLAPNPVAYVTSRNEKQASRDTVINNKNTQTTQLSESKRNAKSMSLHPSSW